MVKLENRWIGFVYDEKAGFFDISDKVDKFGVLSKVYSAVVLVSPKGNETILSTLNANTRKLEIHDISDDYGKGRSLITTNIFESGFAFTLIITLYEKEPFLLIQTTLKTTQDDYFIKLFYPLCLTKSENGKLEMGAIKDWRLLWQDWQSWSTAEVIPLNKSLKRTWLRVPKIIMHSTDEKLGRGEYLSDNFATIKNLNTQKFITLGFISMRNHLTHIGLKVDYKKDELQRIFARSLVGNIPLKQDEEVNSEKLILIFNGMNAVESLSYYASHVQQEMKALAWDPMPVGWCSWYYYFTHVSQEAVLQNAEFLSNHKDIPMEWVQLDDGYFPARGFNSRIGDWLDVNKRFSHGLESLATEIKAKGFKPGIWLAPFIVSKSSDVYKAHPDWVIRDRKANPIVVNIPIEWGTFNKIYALDTTHPEVQEWLRSLFKTLVEKLGYQFLKLDFIYAAAIEGVRYDNTLTRVQAYRKGLEIIRETVGDEVFLLGCGAPLGPSIGFVNGMRVSGDTFFAFNQPLLYWFLNTLFFAGLGEQPSMKSALKTDMIRSFMHNKFWLNDPDCLLVRQYRSSLKSHEIEFEITFMGLCGGILLSSDNLSELKSRDLERIKFLLPALDNAAVPFDLFENNPPTYFKLDMNPEQFFEPYYLVGVFNWTKKEKTVIISAKQLQLSDEGKYHVFEVWTKDYFQIDAEHSSIRTLKKNRANLLVIRPIMENPQLIASSFHISQGLSEITNFQFDSASNEISLEVVKPGSNQGSLYFYIPPPLQEKELVTEAPRSNMFRHRDGLLVVELEFEERATVNLKF